MDKQKLAALHLAIVAARIALAEYRKATARASMAIYIARFGTRFGGTK